MMRIVGLILMAIVAVSAKAQFSLGINVVESFSGDPIDNVQVEFAGRAAVSNEAGKMYVHQLSAFNMDDTLFFGHPDYEFENRPFAAYDYLLLSSHELVIFVEAQEKHQNRIELTLPIAHKEKVQNDTVKLKVLCPNAGAEVQYFGKNGNLIHDFGKVNFQPKPLYAKIAYDLVEDGYFTARGNGYETTVSFKKKDCFDAVYLVEEVEGIDNRELELLKRYFRETKELEEEHWKEQRNLIWVIDSLKAEIAMLKGEPVEILPEEEPLFYEPYPYLLAQNPAQPKKGLDYFKERVMAQTEFMNIRTVGNVTLELTVSKDGRVYPSVIHAGKDKGDLVRKVFSVAKDMEWEPGVFAGKRIKDRVIISIEVVKD
ncbi:MAG: hypothetical protein MI810_03210 [Flavobacteriales bacterium]|nr:hypothetical protein [Flavobacteriales bacterium]